MQVQNKLMEKMQIPNFQKHWFCFVLFLCAESRPCELAFKEKWERK